MQNLLLISGIYNNAKLYCSLPMFFLLCVLGCVHFLFYFFFPLQQAYLLLILKLVFNFGMIVELVLLPVRFAL